MLKLFEILAVLLLSTLVSQSNTQSWSSSSSSSSWSSSWSSTLNSPCINPDGEAGQCMFLRECQSLLTIYRKKVVTYKESEFFYRSRCRGKFNGKPLVCCVHSRSASDVLPKPNECGSNILMINRIFGGDESDLGEFPWIALLWFRDSDGNEMFNCGGTLINNRYVVTAAHCVEPQGGMWFSSVTLGEHNWSIDKPACKGSDCADIPVNVGLEKVFIHDDYRPKTQQKGRFNDIALVRLNRSVGFSDYIRPICLPIEPEVRYTNNAGLEAIAAGWGRTESGGFSEALLKVSLTIVEQQKCAQLYRSKFQVRNSQFCAGGQTGKDTCEGDSGGPLMRQVGTVFYLYGIISFGPEKCGTEGVTGLYTNVAQYVDWIQNRLE